MLRLALIFLFPMVWVLSLLDSPVHKPSTFHPSLSSQAQNPLNRTGTLWSPYEEWSVENPSYDGNPFDLIASVTFSHQESNATHTTQMFYDGGNTWKWRFSGTKTGNWDFVSSSDDPQLNALSGSVTINPNPDPNAYGFVTEYRAQTHTKWARQKGNNGEIEAFVPQLVMYFPFLEAYYNNEAFVDSTIDVFIDEHGFGGFHVPNLGGQWFDLESDQVVKTSHSNPDPRTFEALEMLLTKTHAAGKVVHIWMWGDRARTWSATDLSGGANGTIDKRLQRYIAARLGPLPGWSMGYGFDLFEWTNEAMLQEWHDYMHQHLGWHHYIGGRASKNKLNQLYEGFDYSAYEWHEPSYNDYVDHSRERPDKPAFSEDRFRIVGFEGDGPEKNYTMEQTRRGHYHSAFAGGVTNIWGNYTNPDGSKWRYKSSTIYPNPEWIKTYSRFIENRFLKDMETCNELSNGYCLADPAKDSYLFYRENTNFIEIDLSQESSNLKAVLIDTKKDYEELGPCIISPASHTWDMPYRSDWAVAVGTFDGNADPGQPASDTPCTSFNVGVVSPDTPSDFGIKIENSYPSPFSNQTTFLFSVEQSQHVKINLFDLSGRLVRQLLDETIPPNSPQQLIITADNMSSGFYIVKIIGASSESVQKIHLIR